ncbi:MAG: neutral zinc metallopeptidase, partial [Erythrobacter sp.]|nr:neutral zinc metallopeptidase [Erythrobacter sp.]
MRLNQFNPNNINVRRVGGGGGGGMPGGRLGCGGLIVVLIGVLVFGVDPQQMLGTVGQMSGGTATEQQQSNSGDSAQEVCSDNQYANEACNALDSLNQTWAARFQEAGIANRFQPPSLAFLQSNDITTGCGAASAGMGPFYCPADQSIYIHTGFYDQLARMANEGGDFARLYVIAHEYGHHIQTLTGISDRIRQMQQQNPGQQNQLQVRMELQADCYAGVWAGRNRNLIEPGD